MIRIFLIPFLLLSYLPLKMLYVFSDWLASFLRKGMHYRSDVVNINIARSFPQLNYKEIEQTAKGFYTYFCDVLFESMWHMSSSSKKVAESVCLSNKELISQIFEKQGKIIFLLGHTGNWELVAAALYQASDFNDPQFSDTDFVCVYKQMSNRLSNRIMEDYRKILFRKRERAKAVEAGSIIPYMMENEGRKSFYFFLADQSAKKTVRSTVTRFLNQDSIMQSGVEPIARLQNIPVVYVDMDRYERGKYRVTLIPICEESRATKRNFITSRYAELLEKSIERNKSCWLWSHKRWKVRVNS